MKDLKGHEGLGLAAACGGRRSEGAARKRVFLDHVSFAAAGLACEAVGREGGQVRFRIPARDEVREDPARRRRMLKAVAAEAGNKEKAIHARGLADQGIRV